MKELHQTLALIRGALAHYGPAPTLIWDAGSGEPKAGGTVLRDVPVGGSTQAVADVVETFVQRHGIPRVIELSDGSVCQVGATLSAAGHRAGEPLLGAEEVAGRAGVVRGRVAVVTGGAQGFGERLVRGLVDNGALVFIADLNREGADALAAELNGAYGPVCRGATVDVSEEESVITLMEEVVQIAGGIDLFVSNAGVLKAGSVKELSAKDFSFVTNVNYNGFFVCTKCASQVMAVQNSTAPSNYLTDIVQINSKSGLIGSNKNGAYAGSKFGGIGLVQSFAMELVEDRIKVNALCPGNFLDGPLWSDPDRGLFVQYLRAGKVPGATTVAEVRAAYEAKVPLGRGCTGDDVVRALLYVIEQQYETGQAVPITGGQNMLK